MNPEKFSIGQMTSNSSNGKTSMAKTAGGYLVVIGSLMLIAGTVAIFTAIALERVSLLMTIATGVIATGAALIGGKIIKPTKVVESHEKISSDN